MSSLLIGFLDGKISDTEAIDSYTSKIGGKPVSPLKPVLVYFLCELCFFKYNFNYFSLILDNI